MFRNFKDDFAEAFEAGVQAQRFAILELLDVMGMDGTGCRAQGFNEAIKELQAQILKKWTMI